MRPIVGDRRRREHAAWCFVCLVPLAACERQAEKTEATPAVVERGLLREGDAAPDVTFDVEGTAFRLRDGRDALTVVYFYPRDDTPGCTIEAQEFSELEAELEEAGARVFGVSTQGRAEHAAFTQKYQLSIALVPDEDASIARAFGVPITLGVAKRVTFLIGRDGIVRKVFDSVTARGHAEEVLRAVRELEGP